MFAYYLFVSPDEALDTVLGRGHYGQREVHDSDEAAIESTRSGGWQICLRYDTTALTDFRMVWSLAEAGQ